MHTHNFVIYYNNTVSKNIFYIVLMSSSITIFINNIQLPIKFINTGQSIELLYQSLAVFFVFLHKILESYNQTCCFMFIT